MARADRLLRFFLRLSGSVMLLALPFVFAPPSWFEWGHALIGPGDFPDAPVAEYLARGVSGLCALLGGLFWVLSSRPVQYAPITRYVALAMTGLAIVILIYGIRAGMPVAWMVSDAVAAIGTCAVILVLQWRIKVELRRAILPEEER